MVIWHHGYMVPCILACHLIGRPSDSSIFNPIINQDLKNGSGFLILIMIIEKYHFLYKIGYKKKPFGNPICYLRLPLVI